MTTATARRVGRPRLTREEIIEREWVKAEAIAKRGFGRGLNHARYNVCSGQDSVLLFQISPTLARTGPYYARASSGKLLLKHYPFAHETHAPCVEAGELDRAIIYLLASKLNVLVSGEGCRIKNRTRLHGPLAVYRPYKIAHGHLMVPRDPKAWASIENNLRDRIRQWMEGHEAMTLGRLYSLICTDLLREGRRMMQRCTAYQFNLNDLGNAVRATKGMVLDVDCWAACKPTGNEIVRRRAGKDSHA